MRRPPYSPQARRQHGFVLVSVLMVLLALLVLTAPYLATARNADRASSQLADRAQARLALDAAARHARASLSQSHASVDPTPDWDGLDELAVQARFDPEFLNAQDPRGASWDLQVEDVSGRIDLETAPPQVLGNLWGLAARTSEVVPADAEDVPVSAAQGLDPAGIVVLGGEWVRYGGQGEEDFQSLLTGATRGLGAIPLEDDQWDTDGPLPPRNHGVGTLVLDQRAFAPVLWRLFDVLDEPRGFDSMEELELTSDFVLEGELDPRHLAVLRDTCTVHADVGSAGQWQLGTRLVAPAEAGETLTLRVADSRWFAPGSVVRICAGGQSELRYVAARGRGGAIVLNAVVQADYDAYEAVVEVQRRRPVNLNTASGQVLLALFENLALAGRNQRITGEEATALAALTLATRPFQGLEDWMRRVVLPAAGIEALAEEADGPAALTEWEPGDPALIDPEDGVALYLNGLNANDGRLAFSTMPFAFTSNSVYQMELRAAVSAPNGVSRAAAVRERTELIVPQEELLFLFHRQQDYDEALRHSRRAAWFATGPENTSRYDDSTNPPSRSTAHLGTRNGRPYVPGISEPQLDDDGAVLPGEHIFADTETGGWLQLAPARTVDTPFTQGRMLRFDHETRTLEGRYLPDETLLRQADSGLVRWTSQQEGLMLRGLSLGLWVQPRQVTDGLILDVAGTRQDSDRVQLAIEGADLVLRVLDPFGDHPDTVFQERTEARFALAGAGVPGLPANTWSHLEVDVAGSRPDQLGLRVNGTTHGVRLLGMSRTLGPVSGGDPFIPLESTEGFPDVGVARIGNELVEYTLGTGGLVCSHSFTGPLAGFGGRMARTQFSAEGDPQAVPLELFANGVGDDHPAGTLVQAYGYAVQLASNLPGGGSALASGLGDFRVARVMEVVGGTPESITAGLSTAGWGEGLEGDVASTRLKLALADDGGQSGAGDVMSAFSREGGYAILVQQRWYAGDPSEPANGVSAKSGLPLGGVELIRYSGWSGDELQVTRRGAEVELAGLTLGGDFMGGARVFVTEWASSVTLRDGNQDIDATSVLGAQVFCVPVSLAAPGATDIGFLPQLNGVSQFAQLTRTDQAELTEWVRYDFIQAQFGQLVRAGTSAYLSTYNILTDGVPNQADNSADNGGGDGGGGGGGGNGGGGGGGGAQNGGNNGQFGGGPLALGAGAPRAQTVARPQSGSTFWQAQLGVSELDQLPLSRAVASVLHHRGVLGTFSHAHPAGTEILPVFQVPTGSLGWGADMGRPGAGDAIFLSDPNPDFPGLPVTVHRSHTPAPVRQLYDWQQPTFDNLAASDDPVSVTGSNLNFVNRTYVALRQPSPVPLAANEAPGGSPADGVLLNPQAPGASLPTDARLRTRLSKWPSGERPRAAARVSIGGAAGTVGQGTGSGNGADIPSMVVDEIQFGDSSFGTGVGNAQPTTATQAGALVLTEALGDADSDFLVGPTFLRQAGGGLRGQAGSFLGSGSGLPEDAGLLRIGEEILCYDSRDVDTGRLRIAVEGRGLLGSLQHHHAVGDSAHLLDHIPVSVLAGGIGPEDSPLPLVDLEGFPAEGLVLIGTELIHYTRQRSGGLEMPRSSSEPGLDDGRGFGLFRGRFGTLPQAHAAGTPVILFPFRYWDRWTDRADAPELAAFDLELAQPGALWDGLFFDVEPATSGQAQLGVLQRADPNIPWDADPSGEDGLSLFYQGDRGGEPIEQELFSDRLEWRVFVRYDPGAFDPIGGLTHGWKETPRLKRLGATYLAPGRVLRSVDRSAPAPSTRAGA